MADQQDGQCEIVFFLTNPHRPPNCAQDFLIYTCDFPALFLVDNLSN